MVAINQNDLRVKNAENLIESLTDNDNSYVFLGRPAQWESDITIPVVPRQKVGDMSPPYPDNNWMDFYRTWDQMLSMKKVSDVYHMIPRITWTSGVVYDMYRHDYNQFNRSFTDAQNLYDSVFFVINQNRQVYVCLDNNKGDQSIVEPQNTTDEPFYTSDGYQWLRLYSIPDIALRQYATNNLMPVVYDTGSNSRPMGAVYTAVIDSTGTEYTNRPTGIPDEIPFYYCRILGDGTGAVARVSINQGRVTSIRIVRHGENYTYASLDFAPNRVYRTLTELDKGENGLLPGGDGGFKSTVIISPPGGWGYRSMSSNPLEESKRQTTTIARQLGGTRVGVFSTIRYDQSDFIQDTYFRQMGIAQDISGHMTLDDTYPDTIGVAYALVVDELPGSLEEKYFMGEMITQTHIDVEDPTIKRVSKGMVVGYDTIDGINILRYIQDPILHTDNGELHRFTGIEKIIGDTSNKESTPNEGYSGEVGDLIFDMGYSVKEVDKYSGKITYLTNHTPILRMPTQSERLSLVIEF